MAFPKSARRTALETLYNIWQTDPVLRANVRTWRLWRTEADYKDLDVNQCPWIRITAHSVPAQFADTSSLESPIRLEFELALKGYDVMQMADFWGALEDPVSPHNAANQAKLEGAGITVVRPTLPALTVSNKEGGMLLISNGQMIVEFFQAL